MSGKVYDRRTLTVDRDPLKQLAVEVGKFPKVDPLKMAAEAAKFVRDWLLDAIKDVTGIDLSSWAKFLDEMPGFDAAKIISGIFSGGLIPGLDASKIISGLFPISRIGDLQDTLDAMDLAIANNPAAQALMDKIANALGVPGTGHTATDVYNALRAIPGGNIGSPIGAINVPGIDASKVISGKIAQAFLNITSVSASWVTGLLSGATIPILDQTKVAGLDTIATNASNAITEQAKGWQAIWNGIRKTPTDTTPRSTEQVREAAASLSDDVTSLGNSNTSLTNIVLAPRQAPLWMSKWPQDDVAFATIDIDGTAAPALGQLALIPVTALASRSYESAKFGLAGSPTMVNCYMGIYAVNVATGLATRVRDFGDVRAQLSATANMQSVEIPTPLPATAGQVLLLGIIQRGGIATPMHKRDAAAGSAFTTYPVAYPKNYGMTHGSGLSAMPATVDLTAVTSGTVYWGALGYGVAPPTDPEAYYTSPLKASTDLDIFEFVTGSATGTIDSATGLGIPSGVVQNTHYSHLGRFFQPDQYVQARFNLMPSASYWGLGLGTAAMYLGCRRNPMTGATVYAVIRWEVNGVAFGVNTSVKAYADIYTVAGGGYPGSGVLRRSEQFINRTESGPGSIPSWTRASTFRFRAVGNVYSVIWNDNGGPTTVATWTDSGGVFPVDEFNNASIAGIVRARASMGFSSTVPPGVSDFIMSDIV